LSNSSLAQTDKTKGVLLFAVIMWDKLLWKLRRIAVDGMGVTERGYRGLQGVDFTSSKNGSQVVGVGLPAGFGSCWG
jgi:hypothetical protein